MKFQIRDGDSEVAPFRDSLCGSDIPTSVMRSFSNAFWIRFHSDSSVTAAGFKISFSTAPVVNERFFLLSAPKTLVIMHADGGGTMSLPIPGLYLPGALEFDPVQRRVFWADEGIGEIRSSFLNGTAWKTVFTNQADDFSFALALDPMARLLFYSETTRGLIGMTSLLTGHEKTILSGLSIVFSIVLDPSEGKLFWLESKAAPSISRAFYDGGGRKKIISRFMSSPRNLALDRLNKRLYWVDAGLQKVEWSDYEGRGRSSQAATFKGTTFMALAVTDTYLHLVDWGSQRESAKFSVLRQLNKDGSNSSATTIILSRVEDILFHDNSTWFTEKNGCAGGTSINGGCSHFCLPVNGHRGTRCLCPAGLDLSSLHSKTCRPSADGARYVRHHINDDEDDEDDDDEEEEEEEGVDKYGDDYNAILDDILRNLENPKTTSTSTIPSTTTRAGSRTDRHPSMKSSPGQKTGSEPAVLMYTEDDKGKEPSIVIGKDDLWNRPITAQVHMTGPRPFDTDGSKDMRIACEYEGKGAATVWTGSHRCLEVKDDVCLLRPKVPDDDGETIACQAYLPDGTYGFSSFTIQLNYPPQLPPLITGYAGQLVHVGDQLTMTCIVKGGKPLVSAVDFYCPGHADTEPDREEQTHVKAYVTIRRLTSSDDGVTCVCSAEWKVPEMYTEKAYVTLRVAAAMATRGRTEEL